MMDTLHLDLALRRLENHAVYTGEDALDWNPESDAEEIRKALRIVERLMDEPSEAMAIHLCNTNQPLFQAMRDQLIREARDETTN